MATCSGSLIVHRDGTVAGCTNDDDEDGSPRLPRVRPPTTDEESWKDRAMQRWQYRVVNLGAFFAASRMVDTLAHLGEQGWELVTIYDKSSNWIGNMEKGFALFKRPVASGEEPDGAWAASVDAVAQQAPVRKVQEALDLRGIVAPGAAHALAPVVKFPLDGVARLGADGCRGVIAVMGDRAAVWWSDSGDVASVDLRSFDVVERDNLVVTLRHSHSPDNALEILATNEKYAHGWVGLMRKLGCS